jgi:hypothetical protein
VNTQLMTRRRSAQAAGLVAVLVLALILVVWLLQPGAQQPKQEASPPPALQATTAGSTLKPKPNPCFRAPTASFAPKRITVAGVTRDAEVLALPRDAAGVPQAPPISTAGKTQFAWDIPNSPRPGDPKGNVLLNAHTYPDGSALGNQLLAGLKVGGRIVLRGVAEDGSRQSLCYKVTKKQVIIASDGSWEYYAVDGPPQIAIIVCSPPRLGPGNWLKRTIWYASPITA